jgi:hypothetical protein
VGLHKLVERVERVGLDKGGMIFGETFNNLRVAEATLEAVAFYRAEEYRGRLLNITASERVVPESAIDTRKLWEFLARGGATAQTVPAVNSGQLFVSPYVEAVANMMRAYVAHELSESADSSRASVRPPA